jgi:DNA-directed RNA polymerase specialized sigma24 family protein
LRVVQGRTLRQVGLALGISPGAAHHRITRALARLREMMENDGRAPS